MTRLSKEDWNKLDNLLGKHGFGGYYDLIACLQDVAGHIGASNVFDIEDFKTLPKIVLLLMDWADKLSKTPGFDLIVEAIKPSEVKV